MRLAVIVEQLPDLLILGAQFLYRRAHAFVFRFAGDDHTTGETERVIGVAQCQAIAFGHQAIPLSACHEFISTLMSVVNGGFRLDFGPAFRFQDGANIQGLSSR